MQGQQYVWLYQAPAQQAEACLQAAAESVSSRSVHFTAAATATVPCAALTLAAWFWSCSAELQGLYNLEEYADLPVTEDVQVCERV